MRFRFRRAAAKPLAVAGGICGTRCGSAASVPYSPMTPPQSDAADAMAALLQRHRSIRQFDPSRAVDSDFIDTLLVQALAGSSSSGNLNMVSVVKAFDVQRKAQLHALHMGQPMVLQAPLALTACWWVGRLKPRRSVTGCRVLPGYTASVMLPPRPPASTVTVANEKCVAGNATAQWARRWLRKWQSTASRRWHSSTPARSSTTPAAMPCRPRN